MLKTNLTASSRTSLSYILSLTLLFLPLSPLMARSNAAVRANKTSAAKVSESLAVDAAASNLVALNSMTQEKRAPQKQTTQPSAVGGPSISATKAWSFPVADPDGDNKAEPGQTINYTVSISNALASATDATGVVFSDTVDTNSTFVANSVHASPQARNESYNAVGNTLLEVGVAASGNPAVTVAGTLFDNDAIATDSIAFVSNTNPAHGSVTTNANGSFSYLPAVGYTGADSFTYTIRNSAVTTLTDTATVSITVANMVWYVNNSGSNGDGRSNSPFSSLTPVNGAGGAGDVDGANDIIYLFTGWSNYTTGLVLESGQQLIGNGVALVVNTLTLRAAGTRPTLATSGITLSSGNILSGFNFGNTSGFAIQGTSVGTLNVNNMAINTTGGGLDLTGVSTPSVNVVLDSLTSSGGTKNVNLVGLNGTITLGTGALSAATTTAFDVSGAGNAVITYSGTIGNTAGRTISVANKSGGSVSFSGAVSGSGTGISLTTNTGSIINFTGGISLSTGANAAFTATGGGTVNATQNNTTIVNTLTTTSGTALNVANTTIGSSGLTFRSITSNASGSNNGIILDNTGTTAGLTVTGNGGACTSAATCTGGTISNKTGTDSQTTSGIGLYLNSTSNVSLDRMQLNDFQNFAILGTTVRGFTLTNSVINGTNGTNENIDEASVAFTNLTGSATITNVSVSGSVEDNFRVINNLDRNVAGNSLNRITFTQFTCGANSTTTGDNGLFIQAQLNSEIDVTIQNSTFTSARGDIFQFDLTNTSRGDLIFQNNAVSNNHPAIVVGGGGITLSGGGSTNSNVTFTYDINTNTFRDARGDLLLIALQTGGGSFSGKIRNNTFGVAAVDQSGGREGTSVEVRTVGSGDQVVQIDNNQIRQYGNFGILLQVGGQTANGDGTTGTYNATVTNNTINTPSSFVFIKNGFQLNSGTNQGDAFQVCLNLSSNTLGGSGQNGGNDFQLRQRFLTTVKLPGYGGANNDNAGVVTFTQNNNTGAETGNASNSTASAPPTGPGGGFVGGAACTTPSLPAPEIPDDTVALMPTTGETTPAAGAVATAEPPSLTSRPFASLPRQTQALTQQAQSAATINRPQTSISRSFAPRSVSANTLPVTIGTLTAGKTVTIVFQVTVNNNLPQSVTQLSNQGTVSGSNFSSVLTDDPSVAGAANPTLTPINGPGTLQFSLANYTVNENGGTATINVTRAAGNFGSVSVTYATSDGTATAPGDYTATTNTLTWADGDTANKTFTVPIIDDNIYENGGVAETINLTLSSPTGNSVLGTQATAVLSITENDPIPTISINNVTIAEPDTGTGVATFTISLSNPTTQTVSLNYATQDNTAVAPGDYTAIVSTPLTFSALATVQTVTVTINADGVVEPAETFFLNLSGATNATLPANTKGTATILPPIAAGNVVISEFRLRGAAGANDEFVELFNTTAAPITVATSDGSAGWTLAASDGVARFTVPSGTVIPARGHYLGANNNAAGGYSLGLYPAGVGTTATPNATYTLDIPDSAGIALFKTATQANFTQANALDAVGFTGTVAPYSEGTLLASPGANDGQYSFVRKPVVASQVGQLSDAGDNATDFVFVATTGVPFGGVPSTLGAPGPENLNSPLTRSNTQVTPSLIAPMNASSVSPNRVRDTTPYDNPPGAPIEYPAGTLSIQRRFTNPSGSGVTITRLRFRVIDITTLGSPGSGAGQADLRVLSSTGVVTSGGSPVVTVLGTTLETPPAQASGGGLNSTLTVTLPGGGLTPGASVDVQMLLGINQAGNFRFFISQEALP